MIGEGLDPPAKESTIPQPQKKGNNADPPWIFCLRIFAQGEQFCAPGCFLLSLEN